MGQAMSRKSVLVGVLILFLLAGGVAAVLVLLVRHEPDCYQRLAQPPGEERQKHSKEFLENCSSLATKVVNDKVWEVQFTQDQINSYLDEDFIHSNIKLLPEGINQPRVALEADKIRLAFRYGKEAWYSTIITVDLRVWVAKKTQEPNVVGLELQGLHAGSLPISAQSVLENISEVARRQDIEVTWYRFNGNPVALLRFQATQQRPTVRLERLSLQKGLLSVGGRAVEGTSPLRAMLGDLSIPLPPTDD
jgi:hypothetical protein